MNKIQLNESGVVESCGSSTIGFRIDSEARAVLEERARLFNQSPGNLARQYLLEMLTQAEEREALRKAVTALREEVAAFHSDIVKELQALRPDVTNAVQSLRADLLFSVQALLTSAGRIDEKKAQKWIEENFKPQ